MVNSTVIIFYERNRIKSMFQVDVMSRVPIYEQLIEQVEEYVITGILKAGDVLPSVRGLSVELKINPNTIQKAFAELEHKELIVTVPGKGRYISNEALVRLKEGKRNELEELKKMLCQLKLAGISKNEISEYVNMIYEEG